MIDIVNTGIKKFAFVEFRENLTFFAIFQRFQSMLRITGAGNHQK